MWRKLYVQLALAVAIGLAGLFVARGQDVVLTEQEAGLLLFAAAVALMFRAINRHFDDKA